MILLIQTREQTGKDASPAAGVVDSQSVKTTETGGLRGYDTGNATTAGRRLEIVKRPPHTKGFDVIPKTLGDRTNLRLARTQRRLAKDFERMIDHSKAMVIVTITQLLARRLATS